MTLRPLSNRNSEWVRLTMRLLIEQLQLETEAALAEAMPDAQDRLFAMLVRYLPMVSMSELKAGLAAAERDAAHLAYEHESQPTVMQ